MTTINDSGTRQKWSTGAQRDMASGKGRMDLLPFHAIKLLAKQFEAGATKYGDNNWRKGIPLSRYLDSALRHLTQFANGERDEPHLVSALWNIACLLETRHMYPDDENLLDIAPFDDDPFPEIFESLKKKDERICRVCEGGPGNDGPCLCGSKAWDTPPHTRKRVPAVVKTNTWGRRPSAAERRNLIREIAKTGCSEDVAKQIFGGIRLTATQERPLGTVYISGPMRGYTNFNYEQFVETRQLFNYLGYDVINPADMDAEDGVEMCHREYATRDVHSLLSLSPVMGDAIVMLPGWEKSVGAVAEFSVARWLGLTIKDSDNNQLCGGVSFGDLRDSISKYLTGDK